MHNLHQFGPNIWTVDQPSNFIGVPLGLRMTIMRLAKQQLVIHSMTSCDAETHAAIQTLGEVRYLIAPNLEHTRFIGEWLNDYPQAILYAPTDQLLAKHPTARSRNTLPFHHDDLLCQTISGMPRLREFAFFHKESQTLILTDLAFNLGGEMSLWESCFLRLNGAYNRFTPTRILKSLIKDQNAFCNSIQTIAQWDFKQIIIAHGTPVTQNACRTFDNAFAWTL